MSARRGPLVTRRPRLPRWLRARFWRFAFRRLGWRLGLVPGVYLRHHHTGAVDLVIAGRCVPKTKWRYETMRADPCVYCGGKANTIDHIEPMARGGKYYTWRNQAPACTTCNHDKADLPLLRFLVERPTRSKGVRSSKGNSQRKLERRFVRHMLKPEKCPPPLRHPISDKLMAALEQVRARQDEAGGG